MRIFSIILILFMVFPLSSFAITASEEDRYVYLLHLYYDNGQLFADRDVEFKYDIVAEEFIPEILNTQFPYKGEVINFKGDVAKTFQFDPRRGNPNFLKGTLAVKAPYFPDGQKVNFYDGQGNQLLSIFVSESSFCNDDGVCNPDVGEDIKTCPSDCKQALPVPTVSIEPSVGGGQGNMLMTLIYVLIIAVAGLGGWFGWKWWKGRQATPIIEFPQNPNVQ